MRSAVRARWSRDFLYNFWPSPLSLSFLTGVPQRWILYYFSRPELARSSLRLGSQCVPSRLSACLFLILSVLACCLCLCLLALGRLCAPSLCGAWRPVWGALLGVVAYSDSGGGVSRHRGGLRLQAWAEDSGWLGELGSALCSGWELACDCAPFSVSLWRFL